MAAVHYSDEDEVARRRVGQTVGERYELQRLLGSGSCGAVYEAWHRYTHKSVALKAMHPYLSAEPEAVSRFFREARAAAAIGHRGIPDVLDAGLLEDGRPYIVHELLEGRSLDSAIEAGALDAGEVRSIGVGLLDALAHAHDKGVVHRDVKPENVFLSREGSEIAVRLLDFGVAKNLHSPEPSGILTKPGTALGTPAYMAPEQARGLKVDGRADVWSAGASLYHALIGEPPFDAPSLPMLLMKIVTTTPPRVREKKPSISKELAVAIDRALEPDLEQRWPDARAMMRALEPTKA